MKTSVVALSLLSAVAFAAPEAWGDHGRGGGRGGWGGKGKGGDKWNDKGHWDGKKGPIPYTSTYSIKATPDQVVDMMNMTTGGQPGAVGYYDFGINSDYNLICYHIRLLGLGDSNYQSPARTATHVHQAARGKAGPPRLAFPNPQPIGNDRLSVGCLQGPFTTGVISNTTGQDTGTGFHVRQIEQDPCAFFADVHTEDAVPGAVRGQLS